MWAIQICKRGPKYNPPNGIFYFTAVLTGAALLAIVVLAHPRYGLKKDASSTHSIDLKEKDQIRSRASFTLFCGLLRANTTLTELTIVSVLT